MKLATIKDGTRDGQLAVVSDDLSRYLPFDGTMQTALDDWAATAPALQALSESLANDDTLGEAFDAANCHSPLPRAYQWADGSAYVNHVELVRKARGAEMPETFWTDPLMYQGGSDSFIGPRDHITVPPIEGLGIDMEAEIAVIVDDVPMGATVEQAAEAIRLLMLVNDVSLRGLIPGELAKGFGFFQSKPSSAFSPVAVTPDALGALWDGRKLQGTMAVDLNGAPLGRTQTHVDMVFDMAQLVAHAAKTRPLCAGSIIGSGTISNKDANGGPGKPISEGGLGYSCLAEVRTVETILNGGPKTPFMAAGDTVKIEMLDDEGRSIFGAIEQTVVVQND